MTFVLLAIFILSTSFCSKEVNPITEETTIQNTKVDMQNKLKIVVGAKTFSATLLDNATATALKKMLPMTLEMIELNGNEKYVRLPSNLPANASNPGTIHTGDLMLYGSSTLVLFYESFSTAYTYTKIGRIDDASGLAAALGVGNVKVSFELE
ncbi:MAG: cyclophilin-like fold protein [Haliscomenobacter sp.]|nr:cyclophilin-like fold protein [Haliscomenobacter sp.]